jgi:hypothetical protein
MIVSAEEKRLLRIMQKLSTVVRDTLKISREFIQLTGEAVE